MEDCIFCKIVKGVLPCTKIYEDEKVLAFSDINPAVDGHVLVIPKAHAFNIWDISQDDLASVHKASKKIAAAIKKSIPASGVICMQLNGSDVGQVVMHYHLHLVPCAEGSKLSHLDVISGNGDTNKIKEIAGKIASAIS